MDQTRTLVLALKRVLKSAGLTYRDVAQGLAISEPTVKRMLSRGPLTLARLEQICALAKVEIADLVRMVEGGARQLTELTEAQEEEIVSDPRLLVVAFLVVNGWRAEDIRAEYAFSKADVVRYLARLDRLKLIELLPGNRVRLLVSPRFAWRRNGPIERFFMTHMLQDFLRSPFDRADESFVFLSGMLARSSTLAMLKRLDEVTLQFNELNDADRHTPHARRTGYTIMLAMRPWRSDVFERLRKHP